MNPLWYDQMLATVPASSIEHQENLFVSSRANFLSKGGQGLVKPVPIYPRQNQPFRRTSAGVDKAVKIGPLIAVVNLSDGTLSYRSPNLANNWFES